MDKLTQQGIDAYKAGDMAAARHYLKQTLQQDRGNILAWLWLSAVVEDAADKAFCLRTVLRMDPANETAQRGLAKLEAGQAPASPEEIPAGQAAQPVQESGGYVPPFIFTEEELAAFGPFLDELDIGTATDAVEKEEVEKEAVPEEKIEAEPQPEPEPLQALRDLYPETLEPLPSISIQEDPPELETAKPGPPQNRSHQKPAAKTSFSPWMWAVLGGLLLLIVLVTLAFIFVALRLR